MRILVLIKEVPDMEKVKFDSQRGVVDRSSAEAEINPFDENALQAAVDLKRKIQAEGGQAWVTALTMGPPRAERSLRDAYARGADSGVLMTDRRFGGSDTCATAKTLAAAVKKLGGFDLILCGEKSVDGDTAQVGAEVAEFLGLPHAYYVDNLEPMEGGVRVSIENLGGIGQRRFLSFPAVVGVTKNISAPKLPSVKRKLESLEVGIPALDMEGLSGLLIEEETGFRGSPTKVAKIQVPEERKKESVIIREDPDRFIRAIGEKLEEKGICQEG